MTVIFRWSIIFLFILLNFFVSLRSGDHHCKNSQLKLQSVQRLNHRLSNFLIRYLSRTRPQRPLLQRECPLWHSAPGGGGLSSSHRCLGSARSPLAPVPSSSSRTKFWIVSQVPWLTSYYKLPEKMSWQLSLHQFRTFKWLFWQLSMLCQYHTCLQSLECTVPSSRCWAASLVPLWLAQALGRGWELLHHHLCQTPAVTHKSYWKPFRLENHI